MPSLCCATSLREDVGGDASPSSMPPSPGGTAGMGNSFPVLASLRRVDFRNSGCADGGGLGATNVNSGFEGSGVDGSRRVDAAVWVFRGDGSCGLLPLSGLEGVVDRFAVAGTAETVADDEDGFREGLGLSGFVPAEAAVAPRTVVPSVGASGATGEGTGGASTATLCWWWTRAGGGSNPIRFINSAIICRMLSSLRFASSTDDVNSSSVAIFTSGPVKGFCSP